MRIAKVWILVAAVLPLFLFNTHSVSAQDDTLRVETRVVAPFVIENKPGEYTGFSIDLWDAIAARLGVKTTYHASEDVPALLKRVADGEADLGISAISVTAERNQTFDFSQPMMDSGLQILVRGEGQGLANPLKGLFDSLFSEAALIWLGIAAMLIIIPGHIVWWLERREPNGLIGKDEPYIPSIFTGLWWAAATLVTQAEHMPRGNFGRLVAVLWMFVGVIFVAYYTAQLTASLTIEQIQGSISGPADLPGKTVATTRGSTSAAWLEERNIEAASYDSITAAFSALQKGTADAVVFDSPVLLYYANTEGKGRAHVVGSVFRKEDYGIVFPQGSDLRRRVDGALLHLRESGKYQELYDKWFGVTN